MKHRQWARFTEDVDDIIPLSAQEVSMYPTKLVRFLLGGSNKDGFIQPLLGDEDFVQHELCQDDGLPFLSVRPLVPSLGNVDDSGVHLESLHSFAEIREMQLNDPDIQDL